ncbi:NAD-dependent epimerase/dehydratase family protein [Streptomyces sp. B6B3]|uniref:NAD-dependent epimerase/dehydratase family protein n=1 Tax=Streptomyces sp. B6B3 TaxID=3153570 RepID=UPI00325E2656
MTAPTGDASRAAAVGSGGTSEGSPASDPLGEGTSQASPAWGKVLVTGGSGFLGLEICRQLVARGTEVVSFTRRPSAELERLGVAQRHGDLTDAAALAEAVAGCAAVIHNAALAGVSGPLRPYWATNVAGTRTVLAQCLAHGVRTLVNTSTASVVFRPGGLENADHHSPYPRRHLAAYPLTKARGEALVLAANGRSLATVSLRPHLIWGPGDPHFTPALVRAARGGRLLMPGDGSNLVDSTHVRTAAHAHLLALDLLHERRPIGGRAYFVSQGEPRPLRDLATSLLAAAGVRAEWRGLPAHLVRGVAAVREAAAGVTRASGTHGLSRFLVAELTHPHWFDLAATRRDLGFVPPVTLADGLADLARRNEPPSSTRPPETPASPDSPDSPDAPEPRSTG